MKYLAHIYPVFQSLLTGHPNSLEIQNQSNKMASVASTSVSMDLTAVVPALMQGIALEVGAEVNELKVILVGDETMIGNQPASGTIAAAVPLFRCATAASNRQWSHQSWASNE